MTVFRMISLAAALLLTSCESGSDQSTQTTQAPVALDAGRMLVFKKQKKEGSQVFSMFCASCHGEDGKGGGKYPPLQGSDIVQGDLRRLLLLVHKGAYGELVVDGVSYGEEQMPAWGAQLTPDKTAALFTYLRSAWGNQGQGDAALEPVDEADIIRWSEQISDVKEPLPFEEIQGEKWKSYYDAP